MSLEAFAWPVRLMWWRWRNSQRVSIPAIDGYISALPQNLDVKLRDAKLLAVDLETTSLEPNNGEIVEIGMINIENNQLLLNSAEQILIQPKRGVGESATCHHLTDSSLKQGKLLKQAMVRLLERASGRILVCHHAPLDVGFLRNALMECFSCIPPLVFIDTLQLEADIMRRQSPHQANNNLRLHQCRERYQLPTLCGHHALEDARACAELYLGHVARYYDSEKTSIRRLI